MREVSVETLREEVIRLRGVVTQSKAYHRSGVRLHLSGSPLTMRELTAMQESGVKAFYFLEPKEKEDVVPKDGDPEQAKKYLSLLPKYPPHPPRPDSNLSWAAATTAGAIKPLLAPRGMILVGCGDEFVRALVLNLLAVEGHEVLDRRWSEITTADHHRALDVAIVDLKDAPAALGALKSTAILAAGLETQRPELSKAIAAGAHGSLQLPIRRDSLVERVHGTLSAFSRRVKLKPALLKERRSEPRTNGQLLAELADRFLPTALPVREAMVLEVSDRGLRIEYPRRAWSTSMTYLASGVHPKHFFWNYAKANPLGRALSVVLPPAAGRALEAQAKFVHISAVGDYEVAGLALEKSSGSVKDHLGALRGSPSTRRTF